MAMKVILHGVDSEPIHVLDKRYVDLLLNDLQRIFLSFCAITVIRMRKWMNHFPNVSNPTIEAATTRVDVGQAPINSQIITEHHNAWRGGSTAQRTLDKFGLGRHV